jgi:F-type H+-transporting ATPase subunit b
MQFDLFTFIATIVNFLIIVALLRIFLYKRIVNAIDSREETIRQRWQTAEEEKEQAEQRAEEYRRKQQTLEEERDDLIDQAEQEAQERKQELTEQARDEVQRQKNEWLRGLEEEKERFLADFRKQAGLELVDILEEILRDLADERLTDKLVDHFADLLEKMDAEEKRRVASAIESADGRVRARCSHELSSEAVSRLNQAVDAISEGSRLDVERAPELIAGVELVTPERRVGWSLRDYLEEVGGTLTESLARVEEHE